MRVAKRRSRFTSDSTAESPAGLVADTGFEPWRICSTRRRRASSSEMVARVVLSRDCSSIVVGAGQCIAAPALQSCASLVQCD